MRRFKQHSTTHSLHNVVNGTVQRVQAIDGSSNRVVQFIDALQWGIDQMAQEQGMATLFIGINRGEVVPTTGSSTTGKDVELAIDDAQGIEPRELTAALRDIEKAFLDNNEFTS